MSAQGSSQASSHASSGGFYARPVSDEARDDSVVPFAVEPLDVRGRVARLGASLDHILAKHAYPTPVARLVGEACVLTVLLATSLRSKGGFNCRRVATGRSTCWSLTSMRRTGCAPSRGSMRKS